MALALDATSSGRNSTGSSLTVAHTVGSLTNGALYVLTTVQDGNHANYPVTGITYGGVALTKVRHDEAVGNCRTEIWRLVNPSAGTANIVMSTTGSLGEKALFGVSMSGVDQTTPTDANNGTTGNSSSPSLSVTTVTDGAWVLAVCCAEGTFNASGTGQNVIATLTDQSFENARASYEGPFASAGSQSQSFGLSSGQPWALSLAAIRPAATGSANIKTFDGLVYASTKTVDGLAVASVKTWNNLA